MRLASVVLVLSVVFGSLAFGEGETGVSSGLFPLVGMHSRACAKAVAGNCPARTSGACRRDSRT